MRLRFFIVMRDLETKGEVFHSSISSTVLGLLLVGVTGRREPSTTVTGCERSPCTHETRRGDMGRRRDVVWGYREVDGAIEG